MKILHITIAVALLVLCSQCTYRVYYESGNLKERRRYVNGEKHGKWKGYWESGNIKWEGSYDSGKEHGKWTWYYENGKLEEGEVTGMARSMATGWSTTKMGN